MLQVTKKATSTYSGIVKSAPDPKKFAAKFPAAGNRGALPDAANADRFIDSKLEYGALDGHGAPGRIRTRVTSA